MKQTTIIVLGLFMFWGCKQQTDNAAAISIKKSIAQQDEKNAWFKARIDSTMKANNIPALSVGIMRDGKLSYFEGFGVKERNSADTVNENSVYQIGSDTKKLTGIIANNLVAQGKLSLDASILTYLPETLSGKAKEKLKDITIEDLLLHRAGLPGIAPSDHRIDGDPMDVAYTEADLLKDLNEVELDFKPGTDFNYSNFGYAVVGYICEQVSGQQYSALLKKYVTTPLGLTSTFVELNEQQQALLVTPYRKDARNTKTRPFVMGKLTPAGGIYSNVMDMSILMAEQLKAYRMYEENDDPSPLILTQNAGTADSFYGFGLAMKKDANGTRYGHGGDLDGFASGYMFVPERNIGLILLTSSGGRWIGQLEAILMQKLSEEVKTNQNMRTSKR